MVLLLHLAKVTTPLHMEPQSRAQTTQCGLGMHETSGAALNSRDSYDNVTWSHSYDFGTFFMHGGTRI